MQVTDTNTGWIYLRSVSGRCCGIWYDVSMVKLFNRETSARQATHRSTWHQKAHTAYVGCNECNTKGPLHSFTAADRQKPDSIQSAARRQLISAQTYQQEWQLRYLNSQRLTLPVSFDVSQRGPTEGELGKQSAQSSFAEAAYRPQLVTLPHTARGATQHGKS